MKKNYLTLLVILGIYTSSFAQWTTIYEGGAGTNNSLAAGDWEYRFFFASGGNQDVPHNMFGTSGGINNGARLFYYTNDFGIGTAGIQKRIPGMENYASLRIYVESDLPDSVGTMTYAKMDSSEFTDNMGNPIWQEFASDQIGEIIPFSNTEGKNSIYLFANLLRGDSISFRIHYVRIEADTTQFNSVSNLTANNFTLFSAGNTLFIHSENEETPFNLSVYDSAGAKVFDKHSQGSQSIPVSFATGIYYANIISENGNAKPFKIFIE